MYKKELEINRKLLLLNEKNIFKIKIQKTLDKYLG
ncbi:Uncharacterised protein [Streptococcus mitis]|uniref:Uncharacterized protein n=1 Tax=Streptococcus mitis TaxID=28037 RepID=A0A4U9YTU1_STRMT|nr:Uncharacterised protein [Streptococcus mitis]